MAVVDSIVEIQTHLPNCEVIKCTMSGSTATYTTKFGNILAAHVTADSANATTLGTSDRIITITGTSSDVIYLTIWGKQ